MFSTLEQREAFHLSFLRQLAMRLKPNTYAIKGGVNLRFFFGSARYSEDMDIDVKSIDLFKLKEIVMAILESKVLKVTLRSFMIENIIPPDLNIAKQTETTQRFKIHLLTLSGEDLFTKIEFSRRKLESPVVTETIGSNILQHYKIPPLLVSHYPVRVAVLQKLVALAQRRETQARDIFDLYMLLHRADKISEAKRDILKKAYQNLFGIDFHNFRDTVLNYLDEDTRSLYNTKNSWEEIQLKVGFAITDTLERLK